MGLRRIGRRISRGFRRVTSFAKKAVSTVTRPFTEVARAFTGVVGRVLDYVPFGQTIKQFAGAFLSNPLALLAAGPLGATTGFFGMAASTSDLAMMTTTFAATQAAQSPEGRANLLAMAAYRHAQLSFPQTRVM
ncbi:hypothetical protein L6R52_19170 [Myxococcota bacterium]|nr:hypothetical protein [Myxococcota bacterium]